MAQAGRVYAHPTSHIPAPSSQLIPELLRAVTMACFALALVSCGKENTAHASDNVMEIDLGQVPPRAEIHKVLPLPDALVGHEFLGLQSSCGCVEAAIMAGAAKLTPGVTFPASPLSLLVQFRPKAAAGMNTETVRIRYKRVGSSEQQVQTLRFTCMLVPALSRLKSPVPALIEAQAPIVKLERSLDLCKPINVAEIRHLNSDSPPWLHLLLGSGQSTETIGIEIRDLSIVRDHNVELRIPFGEGISERVDLRIHLLADTSLAPGGVTELVLLGSKIELPVRLKGAVIGERPEDLVLHKFHEIAAEDSKHRSLPSISLRIDEDLTSPTHGHMLLKASGFIRAGAFEGEVLVRPKGKDYQLPLPVFFRVTGVQ